MNYAQARRLRTTTNALSSAVEARAECFPVPPPIHTMSALLAYGGVDLLNCDKTIMALREMGFDARSIVLGLDDAVSMALHMRRDAA